MIKQILFALSVLLTLGVFSYTVSRLWKNFRNTRPWPVKQWGKRFMLMMSVAVGQTKIFRRPVVGLMHALVFWGFCVIIFGSIEMIIDGLMGTERVLSSLGIVYDIVIASGDVFALIVFICILFFMFRRLFVHVPRFEGTEMKKKSHSDALLALSMILLLMVSLLGMNTFYVLMTKGGHHGVYPVSEFLATFFTGLDTDIVHVLHEVNWWAHILLIFLFANILPYSKHFHVFMSVPNVFLSRLEPLGKLQNMDDITREVKIMMDPQLAFSAAPESSSGLSRFGVKDVEDGTWKNYLDSLSCTECGRCTSVCPANITGKKLSPRKIFMDYRARMKEKSRGLAKEGRSFDDQRSLLRNYISEEELWACTTCNACAKECPVNINHPSLIVDMRRYLVMEEGSAPAGIKAIFANIENNGAPWQFSPEDRMLWADDLYSATKN